MNGPKATESVNWLQKIFKLLDHIDDTVGVADIKVFILSVMDRHGWCVIDSGSENSNKGLFSFWRSYDRAEATLEELIPSIASTDHESSEFQERRKAPESALLEAYKSIIDHMKLTETGVTEIS